MKEVEKMLNKETYQFHNKTVTIQRTKNTWLMTVEENGVVEYFNQYLTKQECYIEIEDNFSNGVYYIVKKKNSDEKIILDEYHDGMPFLWKGNVNLRDTFLIWQVNGNKNSDEETKMVRTLNNVVSLKMSIVGAEYMILTVKQVMNPTNIIARPNEI